MIADPAAAAVAVAVVAAGAAAAADRSLVQDAPCHRHCHRVYFPNCYSCYCYYY